MTYLKEYNYVDDMSFSIAWNNKISQNNGNSDLKQIGELAYHDE